jgi:transcription antitermination factor NusG
MSNEKCWYVISIPGIGPKGALQIQSLIDRLEYPGTIIWTPSLKAKVIKHGREVFDNRSLFSGYVFVQTNPIVDSKLEQALMEAKLGHFLKLPHDEAHDLPTPISQEDIEHIKSLEEADVEPIEEEIIDVQVGNLVEVCVGPFMGIKGIINEIKNRTAVIETIVFGRSAPVSVNIAHLSKLTENVKDEKPAE